MSRWQLVPSTSIFGLFRIGYVCWFFFDSEDSLAMCSLHWMFKGKSTWIWWMSMVVSGVFVENVVFEMEIDLAVCIVSYSPKTSATLRLHPSHDWRLLLKFHRFYPLCKMFCQGPSPLWFYLHSTGKTFALLNTFNSSEWLSSVSNSGHAKPGWCGS